MLLNKCKWLRRFSKLFTYTTTLFSASMIVLMSHALAIDEKPEKDDFKWLESLDNNEAKEWVAQQTAVTEQKLKNNETYQKTLNNNLLIYQSPERIAYPRKRGNYYYNFWRDDKNLRGLLRRMTVDDYHDGEKNWEIILDFDKLSADESVDWLFSGITCSPSGETCIVGMSQNGTLQSSYREINVENKKFIEDGFNFESIHAEYYYLDEDTLLIATDFGEGTMTSYEYASEARIWDRNQPLSKSQRIAKSSNDEIVGAFLSKKFLNNEFVYILNEYITFDDVKRYVLVDKRWSPIQGPEQSEFIGFYNQDAIFKLNQPINVHGDSIPAGSLVYAEFNSLTSTSKKANFNILLLNSLNQIVSEVDLTRNALLVTLRVNTDNELIYFKKKDGRYQKFETKHIENGTLYVRGANPIDDFFLLESESLISPTTLEFVNDTDFIPKKITSTPKFFKTEDLKLETRFVSSKDGTQIPYTIIYQRNMVLNAQNPTLINIYGGFNYSLEKYYAPEIGMNWLSRGGVYILAHVRGGSEYGSTWHSQAIKENKHKTFEDFEAIVDDLFKRNITQPSYLGIMGFSNGGTMVAALMMRKPEMYGAVVARAPVADLLNYTDHAVGETWVEEFGDPTEEKYRKIIASYSPYNNILDKVKYPTLFTTTVTNDDIVHPSHVRRFAAKLKSLGNDVMFHELPSGGHYGAKDYAERAKIEALYLTFLINELMQSKNEEDK